MLCISVSPQISVFVRTWSTQCYPTVQSARDAQHHPCSLAHGIVWSTSTRPVTWDKITDYLEAHVNAYASLGVCRALCGSWVFRSWDWVHTCWCLDKTWESTLLTCSTFLCFQGNEALKSWCVPTRYQFGHWKDKVPFTERKPRLCLGKLQSFSHKQASLRIAEMQPKNFVQKWRAIPVSL